MTNRKEGTLMDKSWRAGKLDYMKWFFEEDAERWKSKHDDRRVFSNMYFQIIEAIESLPEEPPAYVCVAMNELIKKDIETMKHVQGVFKNR